MERLKNLFPLWTSRIALASTTADPAERLSKAKRLRAGAFLLGLLQDDPEAWFMRGSSTDGLSEAEIDALVARRQALREQRKFSEADEIRDRLAGQDVVIEDSAAGTRWRRTR